MEGTRPRLSNYNKIRQIEAQIKFKQYMCIRYAEVLQCYKIQITMLEIYKKCNLTAGAVQVEANLQEQLNDHLDFRKLKNVAKIPGTF